MKCCGNCKYHMHICNLFDELVSDWDCCAFWRDKDGV